MNLINRIYVLIPILLATFFTLDPAYAQEELFNSVAKLMDPAAMEEAESRRFVNRFQEQYAIQSRAHDVSGIPVDSLLRLIEPELKTYYLVSKKKFTEKTSEKWEDARFDSERIGIIVQEGTDYAVTSAVGGKVGKDGTVKGDHWKSAAATADWFVQTRQESIRTLEQGTLLQVLGTRRLHDQVERLLVSLSNVTRATRNRAEPINAYRLQVALLEGGKAGELVSAGHKGIGLSFGMAGTISRLPKVGARVEQGEEIAALETGLINMNVRSAGPDETRLTTYGRTFFLKAPVAGTIGSLDLSRLQVGEGEIIATLIPDGDPARKGAGIRYSKSVAQQYGISPEDVEMFGFDGFVELGKAVFWLSSNRGEDRSVFDLGDDYDGSLRIQDIRPPYLVLNAELGGRGKALETTLYLEEDKPSVVGITNLTEALLLVIKVTQKR